MTEDEVTEELVLALSRAGSEAVRDFSLSVFGVKLSSGPARAFWTSKELTHAADGAREGAVVALVSRAAWTARPAGGEFGEGRPDAIIRDDDRVLAIEIKVRRLALSSKQLVNQALSVGLQVSPDEAPGPHSHPAGYGSASWQAVADWLATSVAQFPSLVALRTLIAAQSLAEERPPSWPPALVPVDQASPVDRAVIVRDWDLASVAQICAERYASEPVKAKDCVAERARLVALYSARGLTVPPGIADAPADGGMPPERVLSVLYASRAGHCNMLPNATPKPWPSFSIRTLGSGGDKHMLVAMLAWAGQSTGAYERRVRDNVPMIWNRAVLSAPGLDDLAAALRPALR